MSEPTTPGMKAACQLLQMRADYDSIPEKDDDLDFLIDKVLVALNMMLPSEKMYTDKGLKNIRHTIRDYAEKIRDGKK